MKVIWVSRVTQSNQMYYFLSSAHLSLAWPTRWRSCLLFSSRSLCNTCHTAIQFICSFFFFMIANYCYIFHFCLSWYLPPFYILLVVTIFAMLASACTHTQTHTKNWHSPAVTRHSEKMKALKYQGNHQVIYLVSVLASWREGQFGKTLYLEISNITFYFDTWIIIFLIIFWNKILEYITSFVPVNFRYQLHIG